MGLLNFISQKMIDREENKTMDEENKQMKKKIKTSKKVIDDITKEKDAYKDKYISILEEKGEAFDQYLFWKNKYDEKEESEKLLRKDIIDLKKEIKDYNELVGRAFLNKKITSLAKCENLDDFMTYILRLHFSEKELPLKGIIDTCKKLEITKESIKKESDYLYRILGIDKWEIE